MTPVFALFHLGPQEMMVLLLLGVLFFGRKLPEVGNSLGKAIKEFHKGFRGLEDELANTVPRSDVSFLEQPRLAVAPKGEMTQTAPARAIEA